MTGKIIKGIIVAFSITVLPAFWNRQILNFPKLWILLVLGFLASILQPDYNLTKKVSKIKDQGTEIQIIWSVFISQILAVLEATYLRFPESTGWDFLTTVSLLVALTGLALRTWAVVTLGAFFTMHLSIQEEHRLIISGPYRYFRHPSYAGAFLTYISTVIFLHSWYSLLLSLIILPAAWVRRIKIEEKMLTESFGEEYISYSKSVKKMVPGVW